MNGMLSRLAVRIRGVVESGRYRAELELGSIKILEAQTRLSFFRMFET